MFDALKSALEGQAQEREAQKKLDDANRATAAAENLKKEERLRPYFSQALLVLQEFRNTLIQHDYSAASTWGIGAPEWFRDPQITRTNRTNDIVLYAIYMGDAEYTYVMRIIIEGSVFYCDRTNYCGPRNVIPLSQFSPQTLSAEMTRVFLDKTPSKVPDRKWLT